MFYLKCATNFLRVVFATLCGSGKTCLMLCLSVMTLRRLEAALVKVIGETVETEDYISGEATQSFVHSETWK